MLTKLVRKVFERFGLEVHRKRPARGHVIDRASLRGALRQLISLGLRPKTVIDVGVATETRELYEEFSEANILLIEPLAEYEPFLRRICASYHAQYVLAAAGDAPGIALLNVHPDKCGSSLLKEVEGAVVDGMPRQVPIVTLDEVCRERKLEGPYLIKADVQGAELRVLAGAQRTLRLAGAVILEVTFFGTMIGGPQLCDIVARMKELGFVAYDIYSLNYRPLDGALCQADFVFVREDGPFRASHAFATAEQRKAQFSAASADYNEQESKLNSSNFEATRCNTN
jgi:FkbM family methyltransferase